MRSTTVSTKRLKERRSTPHVPVRQHNRTITPCRGGSRTAPTTCDVPADPVVGSPGSAGVPRVQRTRGDATRKCAWFRRSCTLPAGTVGATRWVALGAHAGQRRRVTWDHRARSHQGDAPRRPYCRACIRVRCTSEHRSTPGVPVVGVGRTTYLVPPIPPNRAGGAPAHSSRVDGLPTPRIGSSELGPLPRNAILDTHESLRSLKVGFCHSKQSAGKFAPQNIHKTRSTTRTSVALAKPRLRIRRQGSTPIPAGKARNCEHAILGAREFLCVSWNSAHAVALMPGGIRHPSVS